jgi:hypothetical protein
VKQLIFKIIFLGALSVTPLVAYNVILDPYSVLRKDYQSMWICPNERYVKTDYILSHPTKYDSFLFGSSRVSQIPVDELDKATGHTYYNMTIVSGVVAENLKILKLFLRKGVKVKNVAIGLDYFSFQMLPLEVLVRNLMYPETLEDKIKFYYTYLFLEPDSGMLHEIKFNGKDAFYDIAGTGGYDFIKREENLKLHPREHEAKFKAPVFVICKSRIEDTLNEIREIKNICKENGINLLVFLNPGHSFSYLCDDIKFMNTVRSRLAELTDFWDFSSASSITEDNYNYYDIIHFRKKIGAMMVERMYNLKSLAPPDFGELITKTNVTAYLKRVENRYYAEKKRLNPPCMPCYK